MKDRLNLSHRPYVIAAVAPALATVLCLLLDPWLEGHLYYLWFLAAVIASAWYGGTRPALLALGLCLLSAVYFFLHPRGTFVVDGVPSQLGLLWFALLGIAVAVFTLPAREYASLRLLRPKLEDVERQLADHLDEGRRTQLRLVAQYRVAQVLTQSPTLAEAAPLLLRAVGEPLGWGLGLYWSLEGGEVLRCLAVWHADNVAAPAFEQYSREAVFTKGSGLPGKVWAAGRAVWVPDMGSDDQLARSVLAAEAGLHGAFAFPVRNGGELLGVMEFFSAEDRPLGDEVIDAMTCIGSQISQFIERRDAEARLRRQEQDRSTARSIQEGLLPRRAPSPPGLRITGRSSPARDVGGDCYDFLPMSGSGDGLGVLVADASGHGMGAALLTAETRAYVRALALTCDDVGGILTLTNRRLTDDIASDHFVTLLLMRLDLRARSFTYANAGHPPAYVLDAAGRVKAVLASTSLPLGVDGVEFPNPPALALEAGDVVLLYTDGILEATDLRGRMFGRDRMLEVVCRHRAAPPDAILDALFQAVGAFARGQPQADDRTAVVLKAE